MPKFKASITRTSYATRDLEFEAPNIEEFKKMALEKAGDLYFSSENAEYEIESVWEVGADTTKLVG
jgi:hypothetical protein